jgi:hypothetical protein
VLANNATTRRLPQVLLLFYPDGNVNRGYASAGRCRQASRHVASSGWAYYYLAKFSMSKPNYLSYAIAATSIVLTKHP